MRTLILASLACLLLIGAGRTEDKPKEKAAAKKPTGTWTRESNGHTMTFAIRDDELTISVKNGDGASIDVEAAYAIKGDLLFGSMTKVTKKGIEGGPDKGDLFSLTFSANDKELTVSDLKGTHTSEDARKLVEGVYTKQK